ncbi:LysR substrate-binding domain-containing protein [Comamonas composti]|uniref:LysR substrate-binding domain-containing protein n=1 Tax=Comamonas composti TaxID=408558 RepID=UPI00042335BF|nr:LysR substrate-binding domain-containing protein [Comamonas composti]
MRMHSPSISELHAFAAAARLGSYSLAARELYVTQGGISRAIARLEEHLGQALFERQGRSNQLTAAGRDYLACVEPALQRIEAASSALRRGHGKPQLRLSVTPTLFSHWLIPRLPAFSAVHPGIALSFAPYRRDDPLTAPEIDAWLRVGSLPWPSHVQADYVIGRDLVPICHPRDLQGPKALRSSADVLVRPLLAHTNYPGNWSRWAAAQGLEDACPAPTADFETVGLLVQAVAAGLGLAVVQRCLVQDDLDAGRVALALDAPVNIERGYFLCRPVVRAPSRSFEQFRDWLLAQAAPLAVPMDA